MSLDCPNLVILDLNLPKKTGRDVLARLRKSPQCAKLPVIIFSSSDDPRDKQEAARLGADDYVVKSSNLEKLMEIGAAVKNVLHLPNH